MFNLMLTISKFKNELVNGWNQGEMVYTMEKVST